MICDEAEVQTLKDVKIVAHLWCVKRGLAILCSMFCVFPAEGVQFLHSPLDASFSKRLSKP